MVRQHRGGSGPSDFEIDAIGFLVGVAEGSISVPSSDGKGNPFGRGRTLFEPADH